MPTPHGLRCPLCGHLTPVPKGRDFITCRCGLRLANTTPADAKPARGQALFGFLTVMCILTATADLMRRLL